MTSHASNIPAAPPIVEPAGFFAWRTPLLPFDELVAWSAGLTAAGAAPESLAAALVEDRRLLRERLRAAVARPEIREALYVASRSLDESLEVWLREPESERGQKVERTLVRYFSRMTSRATPFGLFAGCSTGISGASTGLELAPRTGYRRNTRLDGDYLATLTDALAQDHAWRHAAVYRPNTSLYRAGGGLRYAESRLEGKVRAYSLVAIEPTPALEATLASAADGSRLDPLIDALVDDDIGRDEAAEYVHALVDNQLLVSELMPLVTGPEPIHDLITQMSSDAGTRDAGDRLDQARAALAALDASPLGAPPSRYDEIAALLETLPGELDRTRLFQVDMVKPSTATLGPEPLAEIVRGVMVLHRLTRSRDQLAGFREAFRRRYDEREMPLAEALDEEAGIGFQRSEAPTADVSPLLHGLAFPAGETEQTAPITPHLTLLLHKLHAAWRTGAREITLSDADVKAIEQKQSPPLPASMAALAMLAATSDEAIAAGRFRIFLSAVIGPSGANLLGRFCHRNPELTARVLAHLREEEAQRPDAVFAEIVHLPEGRVGNLLLRPLLRRFEIPFLGRSGAPREQQIAIDDLTISVVGERVVLRSRRLGREVIPRLTAAHNFDNPRNLGLYRFLCALQQQARSSFAWSWGALDSSPFLPRVAMGRLVLSLAVWRLDKAELASLTEASRDERFARIRSLRETLELPRWVTVADFDNVLPVDLENALAVDNLAQLAKGRASLALTELFPLPDELCARGPGGSLRARDGGAARQPCDADAISRAASAGDAAAHPPARLGVALCEALHGNGHGRSTAARAGGAGGRRAETGGRRRSLVLHPICRSRLAPAAPFFRRARAPAA